MSFQKDSPSMPVVPGKNEHTLSRSLWMMLAGPLLVCAVAIVVSRLNDRVSFKQNGLTPHVFTVKAGSLSYFPFNVYKPGRVLGRFQATRGNGDNTEAAMTIEAVITDARDFENWKNGHTPRVIFDSETSLTGRFDIPLPPGQYDLAFDNRLSPLADKTITASIVLDQ